MITYGLHDLIDKDDDFKYIIQSLNNLPLTLKALQIGGTDFKVIKIIIKAGRENTFTSQILESCSTLRADTLPDATPQGEQS